MKYEEACEYMDSLNTRGIKPGLETMQSLLKALNNPEHKLKFIHIAGTNGKGSVAMFIYEILRAQGYRTGLYSSPQVFNPLEIIRINGRNISKADYSELVETVAGVNSMGATRFEVETAIAFLYFAQKECDYVVLETGMGGSLDATNVVTNTIMSVITSVGMDHVQFLGNSLRSIALNKAGIIKENSKVVYINSNDDAEKAITETSESKNTECRKVETSRISRIKYGAGATSFSYKGIDASIKMAGVYQVFNASLAIEAAKWLSEAGTLITDKAIIKGLNTAVNPGRFEIIHKKPYIVLDGAHNVPAAQVLRESLSIYFTKQKYIYIMGMFRDKNTDEVISMMAPLAKHIITVTLPNRERSLSAYELAAKVSEVNPMVTSADSIYEACELAGLMADKDTCIVVFGSLSHLSSAKEYYSMKKPCGKDTKV